MTATSEGRSGSTGRSLSLERRQERMAWVFLSPALAILLVIGFYPLIYTFGVSLTDAHMIIERPVSFVWFENYAGLFRDGDFWRSVLNTVIFTVSSVTLEFVLGLMIALLINTSFKGRGMLRAAILIPWALPTVVSAKMWNFMLVDTFGVINDLMVVKLGLLETKVAWLARPGLALGSVVAVDVWKTTPFVALLLLAGLQLIPLELYEAAAVDGANRVQQFFRITLPLLRPVILVALIFRTLDALRVFDAIWVMTGGSVGTESMATYNYRQLISFGQLGYGSTVSVAIAVIIALFVITYVWTFRLGRES